MFNKQQNSNLTNWICLEESAWCSEYLFEDAVVEGDRGGHTEGEMVEGSDQGTEGQGISFKTLRTPDIQQYLNVPWDMPKL